MRDARVLRRRVWRRRLVLLCVLVIAATGAMGANAGFVGSASASAPRAATNDIDFGGNWVESEYDQGVYQGQHTISVSQGCNGQLSGPNPGGGTWSGQVSGDSVTLNLDDSHSASDLTAQWTLNVAPDDQSYTGTEVATYGGASPLTVTYSVVGGQHAAYLDCIQSSLSVSVSPTVPPGGLNVGSTLTVPVTVSASGGSVSGISLGALNVGGGGAVTVTAAPTGTSGFSLGAGQSRTFNYTVTGVKAGTAMLGIAATGTGADGTAISQSASKSFPVIQKAIQITIAADPGKVMLEADDEGKLAPKTIKVRVKLANTSNKPVTGAQLLSLSPVPADRTQQLDQLAFPRGALPVKFGTIQAGANRVKTFTLKVTGDGTYVLNALALYDDPTQAGGNGRAVGQGGKFTVAAPLLYFKASTQDRSPVESGGSWYVTGHVKNLSSFQTLCLSPLSPHWKDNAGGLGPHQIGVVPVDDPAPPLAGPLTPGETISFLMRVQTESGGTGSSAVVLDPQATKGDPGDACNVLAADSRPALSSAEVKLAKDSTSFRVAVSPAALSPGGAGPLEFFGGYAERSASFIGQLAESGYSLVKEYGSVDRLVAATTSGASAVLSKLYHAAALSAWFWYAATPTERELFEGQVADDFVITGGKIWDGVQTEVRQDVDHYMTLLEKAYLTGDWSSLFHALGSGTAGVLNEQAVQLAEWELAIGVIKKTGEVGAVLRRASTVEGGVLTTLTTVPVGRILKFAEMQRLWGLAYEDYLAFSKIANEEGVLIGVRGRSPISVKNLEEGAVWKHEQLKPKNVNFIDVKYLGFAQSDTGLVAFRTYTESQKNAILSSIAKLDPELQEVVRDRMTTRFGEAQYVHDIEGFSKAGKIDVGFNYADNGANETSTSILRGFDLHSQELKGRGLKDGGTYYRPYQENPALDGLANGEGKLPNYASKCIRKIVETLAKLLCRVTGDMDGVYLTDLEGRALPEAKQITVYNLLAAVGWQHPETLTWIKNGLFDFEKKTNILKELELGGQAMMEFGPHNVVRATYLNLADSRLTSARDYFVAVLGGLTQFTAP